MLNASLDFLNSHVSGQNFSRTLCWALRIIWPMRIVNHDIGAACLRLQDNFPHMSHSMMNCPFHARVWTGDMLVKRSALLSNHRTASISRTWMFYSFIHSLWPFL